YKVFVAINLTMLGLCIAFMWPWTENLRAVFGWLPFALVLGFLPIAAALVQGQDSILLTFMLVAAFVLAQKKLDAAAGAITALGLFKFSIVLPLAGLFFLWGRWRFLAGFVVFTSLLVGISVWVTGVPEARVYLSALL